MMATGTGTDAGIVADVDAGVDADVVADVVIGIVVGLEVDAAPCPREKNQRAIVGVTVPDAATDADVVAGASATCATDFGEDLLDVDDAGTVLTGLGVAPLTAFSLLLSVALTAFAVGGRQLRKTFHFAHHTLYNSRTNYKENKTFVTK